MIFDYSVQKIATRQLDIADIGNTCLRCSTVAYIDYYFVTKTVMGKTAILKFGPILDGVLLDQFNASFKKIDFKEPALIKEIKLYINDSKSKIEDVVEVPHEIAFQAFPNFEETFNNL